MKGRSRSDPNARKLAAMRADNAAHLAAPARIIQCRKKQVKH